MTFECFHVTRALPYNHYPPLAAGAVLQVGRGHNPFFGFYEEPRKYNVTLADGSVIWPPAMTFLKAVRDGSVNSANLPQIAVEVADHYLMLVRELVAEEVRKQVAPHLPSRQSCLWASDSLEQAQFWVQRLGGNTRVLRLEVEGASHKADAGLLLGDSEPLSETYARAARYWRGDVAPNSEPELLISGTVKVVEEL